MLLSSACSFLLSRYHLSFFFFNDTATTEIYTLSLHDALPILAPGEVVIAKGRLPTGARWRPAAFQRRVGQDPAEQDRSEEHTSELQSPCNLVCRLLLEKKKKTNKKKPQKNTTRHRHLTILDDT